MAYLDNATLNTAEYRILYAPASINPGETTEILFETSTQDITGLKADMEYNVREDRLPQKQRNSQGHSMSEHARQIATATTA